MINKPFVSIIIPAYNEEKYLERVLVSLDKQDYPRELFEIIVVDNNSSDNTPIIAKKYADIYDFFCEKPVGKVRNRGVELSKGEFLLFLDSDCETSKNWIKVCVELLSKNRNTVFGGGVKLRNSPYFIEKYWFLDSNGEGLLAKELVGAAIAIRKQHFVLVNGFSDKLTSGEDSKFHQDLIKNGCLVEMTRDISVIHLGNATSIFSFLKRQSWHAESYISRIRIAYREPVFIFVITFLILHALILLDSENIYEYLVLILLLVAVRSLHRIRGSKNIKHLKSLPKIMFIDYLYFSGRAFGFIKSIVNKIL